MFVPLMEIDNLNVGRSNFNPYEAYAPLIVDANAVLPLSITLNYFEMVTRRGFEKV